MRKTPPGVLWTLIGLLVYLGFLFCALCASLGFGWGPGLVILIVVMITKSKHYLEVTLPMCHPCVLRNRITGKKRRLLPGVHLKLPWEEPVFGP
jgi:hypothetical protein